MDQDLHNIVKSPRCECKHEDSKLTFDRDFIGVNGSNIQLRHLLIEEEKYDEVDESQEAIGCYFQFISSFARILIQREYKHQ